MQSPRLVVVVGVIGETPSMCHSRRGPPPCPLPDAFSLVGELWSLARLREGGGGLATRCVPSTSGWRVRHRGRRRFLCLCGGRLGRTFRWGSGRGRRRGRSR